MTEKLVLEIGCGENKEIKGSTGLDVRLINGVDIVADARVLPFDDNHFDYVFSSHVIEHFSHTEVKDVLKEWIRVLKPGGIIELRCPDLRARAFLFAIRPSWNDVINIYGKQDYLDNYHKCGFSYTLLKGLLTELGIKNIKRLINGYKGIPFLPSCLHLKGIKIHGIS